MQWYETPNDKTYVTHECHVFEVDLKTRRKPEACITRALALPTDAAPLFMTNGGIYPIFEKRIRERIQRDEARSVYDGAPAYRRGILTADYQGGNDK